MERKRHTWIAAFLASSLALPVLFRLVEATGVAVAAVSSRSDMLVVMLYETANGNTFLLAQKFSSSFRRLSALRPLVVSSFPVLRLVRLGIDWTLASSPRHAISHSIKDHPSDYLDTLHPQCLCLDLDFHRIHPPPSRREKCSRRRSRRSVRCIYTITLCI
jgi:hypothetical protein